MDPIEISKTNEYLKYIFSDAEKRDIAERMAESARKVREVEGSLKSIKKQFESEIAKHQASLDECSEKYSSGFEFKNVECQIEKNFRTGIVAIFRLDTGECIKTRSMEGEERQRSMDFQATEERKAIAEEETPA